MINDFDHIEGLNHQYTFVGDMPNSWQKIYREFSDEFSMLFLWPRPVPYYYEPVTNALHVLIRQA